MFPKKIASSPVCVARPRPVAWNVRTVYKWYMYLEECGLLRRVAGKTDVVVHTEETDATPGRGHLVVFAQKSCIMMLSSYSLASLNAVQLKGTLWPEGRNSVHEMVPR